MGKQIAKLLAAASFIGTGSAAAAQDVPRDATAVAASENFGDIIVTAQRREERLQDVPVAVTAIGAVQLTQQRIQDVQGLNSIAPSIVVSPGLSASDVSIGLRGVSPSDNEVTVDATVGVYINGLYLARTAGTNGSLIDLERVEVLRGPQGTLFGRNTIGGALNITTARPKDELSGSAEVEYGNYQTFNAVGILNLPIVKGELAARLVYAHRERSGYTFNTFLNEGQGWNNEEYFRGTLEYKPDDRLTATLYFDYLTANGNSTPSDPVYFRAFNPDTDGGALDGSPLFDPTPTFLAPILAGNPTDSYGDYVDGDPQTTAGNFSKRISQRGYNAIGNLTYDFGGATLTSITGYRNYRANRGGDLDSSPYTLVSVVRDKVRYKEFTQEMQLYGKAFDDRLSWILGGFYFRESGFRDISVNLLTDFPPEAIPPYLQVTQLPNFTNKSLSAFGQLTFEVVHDVNVTGGIRYVRDTREVNYHNFLEGRTTGALVACTIPATLGPGADCIYTPARKRFNFTPWTVGLDYRPGEEVLLYGKVSRGFRSGGFQLQGGLTPDQFAPIDPEKLTSYEIGAKTTLLDRKLLLNLAVYRSDYDNIQQTNNAIDPSSGQIIQLVRNSGKARIKGFEAEAQAALGPVHLSGGLSYVDAKYVSGAATGSEVLLAPKWIWTTGADLPIALNGGTLTFHVDANHRSSTYAYPTDGLPPEQALALRTDGYTLLNARIGIEFDTGLSFAVWAKNLTDKSYHYRTVNFNSLGYNIAYPGDPRTYGLTARYKF